MSSEFLKKKQLLLSKNNIPENVRSKDNQIFSFEWITNCSSDLILKLRNAENVIEYLEKNKKITKETHLEFIDKYSNLMRLDFIIINNISEYIGAVNIVFKENRWEIGKYIGNSNYHGKGIAKNSTISMINYFKKYFPFYNELYARTREDNKINIELNKRIGFTIYKHVANNYILMKKII